MVSWFVGVVAEELLALMDLLDVNNDGRIVIHDLLSRVKGKYVV